MRKTAGGLEFGGMDEQPYSHCSATVVCAVWRGMAVWTRCAVGTVSVLLGCPLLARRGRGVEGGRRKVGPMAAAAGVRIERLLDGRVQITLIKIGRLVG